MNIKGKCPYCYSKALFINEVGEISCRACNKLIGHLASGG